MFLVAKLTVLMMKYSVTSQQGNVGVRIEMVER